MGSEIAPSLGVALLVVLPAVFVAEEAKARGRSWRASFSLALLAWPVALIVVLLLKERSASPQIPSTELRRFRKIVELRDEGVLSDEDVRAEYIQGLSRSMSREAWGPASVGSHLRTLNSEDRRARSALPIDEARL